jgi:hypothetical protein
MWIGEGGLHPVGRPMSVVHTVAADVNEGWVVTFAAIADDDGDGSVCHQADARRTVLITRGEQRSFDRFVGMSGRTLVVIDDGRLRAVEVTSGLEQIVNQRPVECYARYETGGCADAFVSASGAIATVSGDRRTVLLAQLGSSAVQEISSELPVVAARIDRTGSWLAIESSSPDAPESLLEESSHGSCAGYDCRVPDVVDVISLRSGERRRVAGARRTLLAQWGVVVSARDGATVVREGAVDQISGPCFVEALGFESGLVLARCDGRWEVSQFGELTEIDRGMIAAVAAASSVDAFDDGESRWLSFDFERAARWDASAARWVEVRRGPCPVIALGQDRRALVLAAAIEGGCRGAWLDQYAWTDPIVPDLCQSSDPSHHLGP